MIIKICFIEVARFCVSRSRHLFVWLVGKCRRVAACTGNNHVAIPERSSIYGVLISAETARHWL